MKQFASGLVVWFCFAVGSSVWAQENAPGADANQHAGQIVQDTDKDFNDAIKDLGELAGEAHACMNEASLAKHKDRVADIFNNITQLFGSDRAFGFAASFGYGSANDAAKDTCDAIIDEFEDRYGAISEKYNLID